MSKSVERLRRLAAAARRSTEAAADDRAALYAAIVEADAAGMPLAEIARVTGLSRGYICQKVTEGAGR
jgi:hypothetical protein